MKHFLTTFLLLLCLAGSATAQYQARVNQAPACTDCPNYIDALMVGEEDGKGDNSLKALRIFPDATGYNLKIVGSLHITAKQVLTTLQKANKYYTVTPAGEYVRIEPAPGVTMKECCDLLVTMLVGDYSHYFYLYTYRANAASKS